MRPSWDDTWLAVARDVAERSVCARAKVGAVIVDRTNRIVATGYNGAPAGWRPNLMSDELPRDYLENCAYWCPRGKNGPTTETVISYLDCVFIHAELNSLMFCDRREREGGTLYLTGHMCWTCAKAVANSGLARVVIADETQDRSYRDPDFSYELLNSSGLEVALR